MTTIYKYRIKCTTDNKYEYTWAETEPSTCPTNTAHTINSSLTSIVEINEADLITVKEEFIPTGGHYKMFSKKMPLIATGVTGTLNFSFNIPHSIISGYTKTIANQRGDVINIDVAPDTIVGVIASDISVNDTDVNVSQTVVDNMFVGRYVKFNDGTNDSGYSEVISITGSSNYIRVVDAIPYAYTGSTPVRITTKYIDNMEIGEAGDYYVGRDKIGSSYIPANTTIRVKYYNKNGPNKEPIFTFESLY